MAENPGYDTRLEALLACAIDYSSYEGEPEEEQEAVDDVASNYGLEASTVETLRSWWFLEDGKLEAALSTAILDFAKSYRDDDDFLETVEEQFDSDVFWADFARLLSQHLFGDPVTEDDVSFAETIEVNDVDPEEIIPMVAAFFGTDAPAQICQDFANSKPGKAVLAKLGGSS